jgi:hypothetical protein
MWKRGIVVESCVSALAICTKPLARQGMLAALRRDYEAMSGMIFGLIPNVDEVVAAIAELEQRLNRGH